MRVFIIFFGLVLAAAAALYLTGAFEQDDNGDDPAGAHANAGGTDSGTGNAGKLGGPDGKQPASVKPEPQVVPLEKPVRMLVLARTREPMCVWMTSIALPARSNLSWQTWFTNVEDEALVAECTHELPPLDSAPSADFLEREKVDVLVLFDFDPEALDSAFWESASARVLNGDMGLWVHAGVPSRHTQDAGSQTLEMHAVLSNPTLRPLLPVKSWKPWQGDPEIRGRLPGTSKEPRAFKVTNAGARHLATRIVDDETWSKTTWQLMGEGERALGTVFSYPITEAADGAEVLVEVDTPGRSDWPVIIAGNAGKGRVLWVGTTSFNYDAWYRSDRTQQLYDIIVNWPAWLTGQGDPKPPAPDGEGSGEGDDTGGSEEDK